MGAPGYAKGGRAYVFTRTAASWHQAAELTPSGKVVGYFGTSVAATGNTIVVGDFIADRAYVFEQTSVGWHQVAALTNSGTGKGDEFGLSVAVSGSTIVVGAPGQAHSDGRAYVFTRAARGWHQVAELAAAGTVAGGNLGWSVGVSGDTVVVGAPLHGLLGGAYVFTRTAQGWHQTAELAAADAARADNFGFAVAISGSTIVVGTPQRAHGTGRAYAFTKTVRGWHQGAEFEVAGGTGFGTSVAVSGTTALVGDPNQAKDAGRAYVYSMTGKGWQPTGELVGSATVVGDYFGSSVAVSGHTAVVGPNLSVLYANNVKPTGPAYVFQG